MTKQKLTNLLKYQDELKNKLSSVLVPAKHVGHPESYKLYLTNELRAVTATLDAAKLESIAK